MYFQGSSRSPRVEMGLDAGPTLVAKDNSSKPGLTQ